jgi:hypothetical protein
MRFGTQLLYTVGALLGIAAIAYFGTEILAGLSPEIKAVLLFLIFVFFLVSSRLRDWFEDIAYVLAAGSFLIFVAYLFGTFSLGTSAVFVVLALSSVLFVGLGYLENSGRLDVPTRTATAVLVVVVALGAGVVVVDMLGPQPEFETTTVDELDAAAVNDSGLVTVGETTVTNNHFLSRSVRLEDQTACLYDGDTRFEESVQYVDTNQWFWGERFVLGPGEQRTFQLQVDTWVFHDFDGGGLQGVDSIPVSTAKRCPDSVDEPQIVIAPGESEYGWVDY